MLDGFRGATFLLNLSAIVNFLSNFLFFIFYFLTTVSPSVCLDGRAGSPAKILEIKNLIDVNVTNVNGIVMNLVK